MTPPSELDAATAVLKKALQAVVNGLPPGYKMALAILHPDGAVVYGLSPGLTNETAQEMFGLTGSTTTHDFSKVN